MSNSIGGPAEQRAVIQFRHRCVRDDRGCAGPGDMTGGHVDTLGGIVEGPTELNLGGVRVHLAGYVCLFLFRHAVHLRLIRFASGRDWNSRFESHQFFHSTPSFHDFDRISFFLSFSREIFRLDENRTLLLEKRKEKKRKRSNLFIFTQFLFVSRKFRGCNEEWIPSSDHLFNDTYTLRSNKTECSPHPLPCYIRRKCNCLRFYGRRLATPGFDYWLWYPVWRWSEEFSPVTKSDWYTVDEFIHTIRYHNAWKFCIGSRFSRQFYKNSTLLLLLLLLVV